MKLILVSGRASRAKRRESNGALSESRNTSSRRAPLASVSSLMASHTKYFRAEARCAKADSDLRLRTWPKSYRSSYFSAEARERNGGRIPPLRPQLLVRVPEPVRASRAWVLPRVDDRVRAHVDHCYTARAAGAGVERGVDEVAVPGDHRQVTKRSCAGDLDPLDGKVDRIDEGQSGRAPSLD